MTLLWIRGSKRIFETSEMKLRKREEKRVTLSKKSVKDLIE